MKKGAVAKTAVPDAGTVSAELLAALRRAGPGGAKSSGLRTKGSTPAATARRATLAILVADKSATLLGVGVAARYFLTEHAPTPATVAARLLALGALLPGGSTIPPTLWKEGELQRKLSAHERPLLAEALARLQAAKEVVPLRQGRNAFWLFVEPLRGWLGPVPPAGPIASVPGDVELLAAYAELVRESGGFPDVKIAGLRRTLPGGTLAARLHALWREGRATFSLGDWSLADETTRAASVELDGEKYLLVRLEE